MAEIPEQLNGKKEFLCRYCSRYKNLESFGAMRETSLTPYRYHYICSACQTRANYNKRRAKDSASRRRANTDVLNKSVDEYIKRLFVSELNN